MNPDSYARALRAVKFSRLLTPEEVRPFLDAHREGDTTDLLALKDKFPSPHAEDIHQFLDQHFPESKRTE